MAAVGWVSANLRAMTLRVGRLPLRVGLRKGQVTAAVHVYARSRSPCPLSASKFSAKPDCSHSARNRLLTSSASSVKPDARSPSSTIAVEGAQIGPRQ